MADDRRMRDGGPAKMSHPNYDAFNSIGDLGQGVLWFAAVVLGLAAANILCGYLHSGEGGIESYGTSRLA